MMTSKIKPLSSLRKLWNVLTQRMETVLIRRGDDVVEFPVDSLGEDTDWQLCDNTARYAVFCDLVYEEFSDSRNISADMCPRPILSEILDKWEFIPVDSQTLHIPWQTRKNRWLVPGLKYHFWYSKTYNEFVIVFRGTHLKLDWLANLRWVTRFVPFVDDHYDVVRSGIQELVNSIRKVYGDTVNISVTGHSLGGGLAQQAAYAVNCIESVYTFNSSPVTGFYEIPKVEREANARNLRIVRIFEHGEILAYLRLPLRLIYRLSTENPEIHELRFNLLNRKDLISEHSMKEFSRFLFNTLSPKTVEAKPPQLKLPTETA